MYRNKDRAEIEGMSNQCLSQPETHPMKESQPLTLLTIFCYACIEEFSIAVLSKRLEKHLKCLASLVIRETQIKSLQDSISHLSEWLRSKSQEIAHAVEDVEKGKYSSIAEECKLVEHFENKSGASQKTGNIFTSRPRL